MAGPFEWPSFVVLPSCSRTEASGIVWPSIDHHAAGRDLADHAAGCGVHGHGGRQAGEDLAGLERFDWSRRFDRRDPIPVRFRWRIMEITLGRPDKMGRPGRTTPTASCKELEHAIRRVSMRKKSLHQKDMRVEYHAISAWACRAQGELADPRRCGQH